MSHYTSNKQWRDSGQLPTSSQTLSTSPSSKTIEIGALPPFRLPRRYARLALGSIIALSLFYLSEIHMLPYRDSPSLDGLQVLPKYPSVHDTPPERDESGLPPIYEEYRKYEDLLSEQHLTSGPEGSRYIYFANHAHGSGWGNVLQEMVFSVMLASEAKLGYVWDDYTWDRKAAKYSLFNGKTVSARIPLSTMLSGHILGIGGLTNESDPMNMLAPSISSRVYQQICPQHDRAIIDRRIVQSHLDHTDSGIVLSSATGMQILNAWLAILETPIYKAARCIEVNKNASDHVFDIWLLGSPRMHSLWDTLSHSPVLANWAWSPLIKRSFLKNIQFFAAEKLLQHHTEGGGFLSRLWKFNHQPTPPEGIPVIIPEPKAGKGLMNDTQPLPILVLHLRRGDFKAHCNNLAGWSSTYTGFNSFPESRVRDAFNVPEVVETNSSRNVQSVSLKMDRQYDDPREVRSMDEKKKVYAQHCFPDVQQIVKRVREVVRDYAIFAEERRKAELARPAKKGSHWWNMNSIAKDERRPAGASHDEKKINMDDLRPRFAGNEHLKKIYIMANGDREWLGDVKEMLMKDARSWSADSLDHGWTWEGIATSRDLDLGWEEKPVGQALDMYVAHRAEVFIGNGFSSLTSNTVMLRMKMGFDSVQTRFW